MNIYTQCSWYLYRLLNFYRIKLIRKYNFNSFDSNIIIFELVYKTVITMIDINDALQKLNILNLKKSKDSINKLMNLIKIDQKTNKSFSSEIVFAFFVLSAVSTQITFKKSLNFLSKFSRSCILIMHEQSSSMRYRKSLMSRCINN